jgi:hypothetical protein
MANVAVSVHVLVICRSSLNCKKVCLRFQKVSSLERFDRNGFSIEEMLKLCAIDEARLEAAETLLSKGFPSRSRAFWRKGLRRLADQNRAAGQPSVGFFLLAGETPVGILLTISRWDAQTGRRIVNLSSWLRGRESSLVRHTSDHGRFGRQGSDLHGPDADPRRR